MTQKTQEKPRIFVGSSVEGLSVADAIQLLLEHDAEVTIWTQGIFVPSSNALDDLIENLSKFDLGIFVFSPDDISKIRQKKFLVARDNVIFEMGLFVGRLGKKRTLYIVPRGINNFHLPSDLIGVSPLDYEANRSDGNLQAALGSVCTKIKERIKQLGRFEKNEVKSNNKSDIATSIFTSQEETDFNFIYSKLNAFGEAKCHVSIPTDTKQKSKEKGCLFKYSFFDVLAKNISNGTLRYDDKFLDFIKFEDYESFRGYIEQGYKFGTRHIGKKLNGLLTSLGLLTPQIKEDIVNRDYAIYRLSEKSYRFTLWLEYHNKIKDIPDVEFIKFLESSH